MARAPGVRSGSFSESVLRLGRSGRVTGESGGQVERENGIAALGGAILHNIFPIFLVIVFLRLAPGLAGGEVDGLRIHGPRKGVDLFFALGHGKGLAAVGRNEVELAGGLVFGNRI